MRASQRSQFRKGQSLRRTGEARGISESTLTFLISTAYLTNPSAASFRTHLTSLSFHTHLRRLSSSEEPRPTNLDDPTNSNSGNATNKKKKPTLKQPPPTSEAAPHVLSFSNRISLSVRTPPFTLQSYYFFSTVIMSPPPSTKKSAALTTVTSLEMAWKERLEGGIWIGAFGGWYPWKWDGETPEMEARLNRLKKGVLAMEVDDPLEEEKGSSLSFVGARWAELKLTGIFLGVTPKTLLTSNPATTEHDPSTLVSSTKPTNPSRSSRSKRGFRPGQQPPTSLARLRSTQAEASSHSSSNSPVDTNVPTPSPSTPQKSPVAANASHSPEIFAPKDTLPHLAPPPPPHRRPVPGHYNITPPSVELGLAPTEETSSDPPNPKVVDELKLQLEELKETTLEIETRLQTELEEIRERKKREDALKLELKAKTKALEEEKRLAELKRVEAERELAEKKTAVKVVSGKVDKLREEIGLIARKESEIVERKEKKKRERKERERKLKEDVVKKKDELRLAELGIAKLLGKVTGLEKTIDVRREMLNARRTDLASRNLGFMPNGMRHMSPYGGYAQSMPSSRPSSVRSGHMDHYSAPFDPNSFLHPPSAPSSPGSSFLPVSPDDDPYHDSAFYSGPFAPDSYPSQQHSQMSRSFAPFSPPLEDTPAASFQPFDFESNDPGSEELRHHSNQQQQHQGGQHSHSQSHDEYLHRRPVLPLPLQYLVTTESSEPSSLDGVESPHGLRSPMTPHQTSLIPSELFQMLDEDDEDDFVMAQSSHSPSLAPNSTLSSPHEWSGLQLAVSGDNTAAGHELDRKRAASASPVARSPLIDSSFGYSSPVMEKAPSPGGINSRSPTGLWDPTYIGAAGGDHSGKQLTPEDPDDLPRQGQGLSLNPDAKAFAFRHGGGNGTGSSSLDSPLVSSLFNSVGMDRPAKSRMDFASSSSNRLTPPSRPSGTTTTAYEWQTTPRVTTPTTTAPSTTTSTTLSFNPFDDGDDLLGPLKK